LNYSREPREDYLSALRSLTAVAATDARLRGFYELLLPSLAAVYRRYIERSDRLVDEPTVLICEAALREIERMQTEHRQLLRELPGLAGATPVLPQGLERVFAEARDIVDKPGAEIAAVAAK
jgi:hypothetical protein